MNKKTQHYIGRDQHQAKQRIRMNRRLNIFDWLVNFSVEIVVILLLLFVMVGAAFSYQEVKELMEYSHAQSSQLEKIIKLEL